MGCYTSKKEYELEMLTEDDLIQNLLVKYRLRMDIIIKQSPFYFMSTKRQERFFEAFTQSKADLPVFLSLNTDLDEYYRKIFTLLFLFNKNYLKNCCSKNFTEEIFFLKFLTFIFSITKGNQEKKTEFSLSILKLSEDKDKENVFHFPQLSEVFLKILRFSFSIFIFAVIPQMHYPQRSIISDLIPTLKKVDLEQVEFSPYLLNTDYVNLTEAMFNVKKEVIEKSWMNYLLAPISTLIHTSDSKEVEIGLSDQTLLTNRLNMLFDLDNIFTSWSTKADLDFSV